jgi:hypothetical protein
MQAKSAIIQVLRSFPIKTPVLEQIQLLFNPPKVPPYFSVTTKPAGFWLLLRNASKTKQEIISRSICKLSNRNQRGFCMQ